VADNRRISANRERDEFWSELFDNGPQQWRLEPVAIFTCCQCHTSHAFLPLQKRSTSSCASMAHSKPPPAAEEVTGGGRRTKAGRTGGMVADDFKQRSENFSDT
jgi:hypothetical protein